MTYLVATLWLPCLIALILGVGVGFATYGQGPSGIWQGWMKPAIILFVIGLFVAALQLLRGRLALVLDVTLLLFGLYIVGCLLGTLLRWLQSPRLQGVPEPAFAANVPTAKPVPVPVAAPVPAPAPVPVAAPLPAPEPQPAQPAAPAPIPEAAAFTDADKPIGLLAARNDKADDLKRIRGIGRQNEARLHELGIWHFDQIAAWTPAQVSWVGHFLAFPGRIEREDWVGQAKILASGGITEFASRVDKGEVPTSSNEG